MSGGVGWGRRLHEAHYKDTVGSCNKSSLEAITDVPQTLSSISGLQLPSFSAPMSPVVSPMASQSCYDHSRKACAH